MSIDWGAAARNNNFAGYFQLGQELGQQAIDNKVGNALTAYVTNPKDAAALATITRYDPKTGLALREKQAVADEKAKKAELTQRAAGGDKTALLELWGLDSEAAKGLDRYTTDKALEGINYITNAAFQIKTLPVDQQAAAWDSYIDRGIAQFPGLAKYKGQYSEENLNSIVAQAGKMQELQTFMQPKYVPVGEGGLQGFQFGVPIGGNAAQAAPQAPQGGVQEGAIAVNKQTGEKLIFRSGKWEKMGGQPGGNGPFGQ